MKEIKDIKISKDMKAWELVDRMEKVGFQAMHLGKAAKIITKMKRDKAKVFLSFTSNMVSSGLRGLFTQLAEKKFADFMFTTSGAIEEDLMKTQSKFLEGSFYANDKELAKEDINRIGNIYLPSEAYVKFEELFLPMLESIYEEYKTITPSQFIYELGKRINNKDSFVYWAYKNNIPIFCPALTDGAIGLQLYFFKQDHKDFKIDIAGDIEILINKVLDIDKDHYKKGGIMLGGGIPKHHAILSTLLSDGFDYLVYLTTAMPFSGSLSGATTQEAMSWKKSHAGEEDSITLYGDVTITFPLIMTKVFKDLDL